MNTKEKAKELVDRMLNEQSFSNELYDAKQCALIAVQELIDQCHSYREIDLGMSLDYWEEVKQEIINL